MKLGAFTEFGEQDFKDSCGREAGLGDEERIVAQFDSERAQGERDLEEFFAEGDRAVLAHDAFGAGVKKRGDFVGVFDVTDGVGVFAEALVWGLASGAVEAQGQLEVALDVLNEALNFAFALGVVRLGGQAAPQHSLHEAVEERGGVGMCVVAGKDDEPALVVNDDAEVGGNGLAVASVCGEEASHGALAWQQVSRAPPRGGRGRSEARWGSCGRLR